MAGEMEVAKGMLRTLIKVTFGYPAILWARSFLTYTNPAALTCLLNVLVNLT